MRALNAKEFIAVVTTVASAEEGERIAGALVDERQAACVNILGPVRSIYTWKGTRQCDTEHVLLIKTRRAHFDDVAARLAQLHSYDTPEIIAFELTAASEAYLRWIAASTAGGES